MAHSSAEFTIVLKYRASSARGGGPHLPAKCLFTIIGFLLMWSNFRFEGVLFGPIPDIMMKWIAYWSVPPKRTVMTVAQWLKNLIIRGLWLLAKKS